MLLSDITIGDWVRLADSPRHGIHAGQTMLVVGFERHGQGMSVVVECEDEHAIPVKAADLRLAAPREG